MSLPEPSPSPIVERRARRRCRPVVFYPAAPPGAAPAAGVPDPEPRTGPAALRELGRAYLWSGEPQAALEILAPLHRERPADREVQSLILESLFALGKREEDYPWVVPPAVVRVGEALLERLAGLLAAQVSGCTLLDLCLAAAERGHPDFSADELLDALEADERFAVRRSGFAPECALVWLRRGSRARGCPRVTVRVVPEDSPIG